MSKKRCLVRRSLIHFSVFFAFCLHKQAALRGLTHTHSRRRQQPRFFCFIDTKRRTSPARVKSIESILISSSNCCCKVFQWRFPLRRFITNIANFRKKMRRERCLANHVLMMHLNFFVFEKKGTKTCSPSRLTVTHRKQFIIAVYIALAYIHKKSEENISSSSYISYTSLLSLFLYFFVVHSHPSEAPQEQHRNTQKENIPRSIFASVSCVLCADIFFTWDLRISLCFPFFSSSPRFHIKTETFTFRATFVTIKTNSII